MPDSLFTNFLEIFFVVCVACVRVLRPLMCFCGCVLLSVRCLMRLVLGWDFMDWVWGFGFVFSFTETGLGEGRGK